LPPPRCAPSWPTTGQAGSLPWRRVDSSRGDSRPRLAAVAIERRRGISAASSRAGAACAACQCLQLRSWPAVTGGAEGRCGGVLRPGQQTFGAAAAACPLVAGARPATQETCRQPQLSEHRSRELPSCREAIATYIQFPRRREVLSPPAPAQRTRSTVFVR